MRPDEKVVALEACADRCVHPDKVEMVRRAALSTEALTRSAALFKLLGDPTRLHLLSLLLDRSDYTVGELAAAAGVSVANASQHLRRLEAGRSSVQTP